MPLRRQTFPTRLVRAFRARIAARHPFRPGAPTPPVLFELDVRTLFAVLMVVLASAAVLLSLLYRLNPGVPGTREWALGMSLIAIGVALLFPRGMIPTIWSIAVANVLVLLGQACLAAGARRFTGRSPGWWLLGGVVLVFSLPTTLLHAEPESLTLRLIAISAGLGVLSFLVTHALAHDGLLRPTARNVVAGILFLHGFFALARALGAVWSPPGVTDLMQVGLGQAFYYFWSVLFALGSAAGLSVMVTERLRDTLEARIADLATAHRNTVAAMTEQRNFLTMVSHEFRTPLGIISASADVIACTNMAEDAEAIEEVRRIRRATERMDNLVGAFLADDWLDSMSATRRSADVDLVALLTDLAREFEVPLDAPKPRLPRIDADPYLLPVAFSALLDNARKYAHTRESVRLSCHRAGATAVVEVRDDGPGIAPGDVPRVFEKFYRASRTLQKPGGGLGLYFVRRIVNLHGGTVEIDQRSGTVFRVTLPLPKP